MIRGQGQGLFDPGSSDFGGSTDFNGFTNEILSVCLTCTAFASLLYVIFQKISCFNRSTDPNGKFTESNGMLCCKNILCVNQDRTDIPLDDVETVKSMDISEYGPDKQLPAEVNAAAYATAQFLQSNNGLNNLTPSDRAKLAENRQVMKAYLISKLVAPRYEVDESGRINPEHFKKGHLGSTEYHQRQSAMFHLVFNGHISVDTKATKRQQRDAIKRLKRCNRERHKENHTEKNICSSKLSISEKETSGVGSESRSIPVTPPKKTSDHKRAEIKRQETKITLESGLEISQSEQQTISDTPMTSSERNFTGNSDEAMRNSTLPKELKKNKSKLKRTPSSSSESSHGSANVEQRAALSRLVETLRVKPEHQTGSVIQYDADVESHDGNRKLDHKTKSQLESIQESGIGGGGGVRYAPESDSELDTLSEESEDDIEESIVLDNHDDIDQVYSIQNQSRKIRRSVSDKLKPTTSCDHDGRPRWPSSNALS